MRYLLKAILLITLFSVTAIYAQEEFNSLSKLVRLDPKVTYVLMQIEIPILSGLPESKYFYEIHGKHQITDSWASLILEDAIEGRINLYKLACLSSLDSLRLNTGAHSKPTRLLPEKIIPYVHGCPNGFSVEAPDRMDYLITNQLALNHRARVWMFFPVGKKGKPLFAAYDVIWSDPGKVFPDIPLVFTDFVDITTQKFRVIQDSLSVNQYFEGLNYFWKPIEGVSALGAWMNCRGMQLPDSWNKLLNKGIVPRKMFKKHLHTR